MGRSTIAVCFGYSSVGFSAGRRVIRVAGKSSKQLGSGHLVGNMIEHGIDVGGRHVPWMIHNGQIRVWEITRRLVVGFHGLLRLIRGSTMMSMVDKRYSHGSLG